jgi:hypothetical protein
MAAEIGHCPSCDVPLMLTCEFRALTTEDLEAAVKRQRRLAAERERTPLV